MTDAELKKLVADAYARLHALTPEQQAEHWKRQRESFVRAFMPYDEGTRTVNEK